MKKISELLEKGFRMEQRWPAMEVSIEMAKRLCRRSLLLGLEELSGEELILIPAGEVHTVCFVGTESRIGIVTTVQEELAGEIRVKCVFSS